MPCRVTTCLEMSCRIGAGDPFILWTSNRARNVRESIQPQPTSSTAFSIGGRGQVLGSLVPRLLPASFSGSLSKEVRA